MISSPYVIHEEAHRRFVVTFSGRLDVVEARTMRTTFTSLVEGGCDDLVANLAFVDFLDSAALAALVSAMKAMQKIGGNFWVVAPRSVDALRIFRLTRFDHVFSMIGETVRS